MNIGKTISSGIFLLLSILASAQKIEPIPFGDFENWLVRDIQESYLIGGNVKRIFAIAPNGYILGNIPYHPSVSPWATSNALAIVKGIVKASNTVYPKLKDNDNRCASLESTLETCYVLGLIKIKVMATGTIFLGEMVEPITNTDNPYSKLNVGIAFTHKPKALIYDYRAIISTDNTITKATGWSVTKTPGNDYPEIFVLLQNRKELSDGSIIATRIGTAKEYLTKSSNGWVYNYKLPIVYGDPIAQKKMMDTTSMYYAKNSNGKMVAVQEIGWGTKDMPVTHIVVFFSSGHYGAYIGTLGNILEIDNVKLEY